MYELQSEKPFKVVLRGVRRGVIHEIEEASIQEVLVKLGYLAQK